jgi:hypothetical protein
MIPPNRTRVVALAATLAAVAAGAAWYRYAHSPNHALRQLAVAIEKHDATAAHEYLDVQSTAAQVVNAVTEAATAKAVKESNAGDNGFTAIGTAFGMMMIEKMKPVLVTTMRSAIDRAIAAPNPRDGVSVTQACHAVGDSASGRPAAFNNVLSRLNAAGTILEGVDAARVHGDSAAIDLHVRDRDLDTTLVLTVSMRRVDGPWRVIGFDNIGPYLSSVDAIQDKRLAERNAPINARLAQLVSVGDLGVQHQSLGYFSEYLKLRALVHNTSSDTIVGLYFALDGPSVETGRSGLGLILTEKDAALLPGGITAANGVLEYNEFMDGQNTLRYSPERFTPRLAFAIVQRGAQRDTIVPYETWGDYLARSTTHRAH